MASSPPPIYLSVVIPAYNEEKTVLDALTRVDAYRKIKGQVWEVIIVDDGSTDRTAVRVQDFIASSGLTQIKLLSFDKNRGKGAAVRAGMLEACGEYALLTDTDLSSPIKEVDKLIHKINQGVDIAIGSRVKRARGCDVRQSFKRALSGRIFNFFVRLLVMRGIRDTQCGFKCFRRIAAHDLFASQKLDGFSFDVEILYLARKKGYKISEVPVMWAQARESKVSLFRDSFRMLGDLFRIKSIHRRFYV